MEDITAFVKTDKSENTETETAETTTVTEKQETEKPVEETPKIETKRITLKAITNVTPPIYIKLMIPKTDDIYVIKNAVVKWMDYNTHCLYDYQIVEESEIDKKFYRAARFPRDTNGNSFTIFVGRDSTEYINDYFDAVDYEIMPIEIVQKSRFNTKVRDFKLKENNDENTEEEKPLETDNESDDKSEDNNASDKEDEEEKVKEENEDKEEKANKKRKKHRWLDIYDDDDDEDDEEDDEDTEDETTDKRDRKKTRKKSLLFHGRSRS